MKWNITVLGMSIFLFLPSVSVRGTLNISLVSHRITRITDKKVLLSLLPANTKLFLPVPFLIPCAVNFYTTQMFWHLLLPVKSYSISYLITHSAKLDFSYKIDQQRKKTQNPTKTPWCITLNFLLSSYFILGQLEKYFLRTISYPFPCFSEPTAFKCRQQYLLICHTPDAGREVNLSFSSLNFK